MYLMSTVLNAPPPPGDLLFPHREGVPMEDVNVEVATERADGVTIQAEVGDEGAKEVAATGK